MTARLAPAISPDTEFFWNGLREHKLLIQRCKGCGTLRNPARPMCPHCRSLDWEAIEASGRGTVYSYVMPHEPKFGFFEYPYVVVLVELPAADARRVLGVLDHADGLTPRIGAAVRGVIEQPPDDRYWPLVRWHLDPDSDLEAR